MSDKPPRTLQTVSSELAELFGEIGFLQWQVQEEMPHQIEKRMNQVHDLQKEQAKLQRQADDAHQMKVDALKAQMNGKSAPTDITPMPVAQIEAMQ